MRIGILTLHDSPNYGAVLQAYAMRAYLTGLGHEAFVIDRRRDAGPLEFVRSLSAAGRILSNSYHAYVDKTDLLWRLTADKTGRQFFISRPCGSGSR